MYFGDRITKPIDIINEEKDCPFCELYTHIWEGEQYYKTEKSYYRCRLFNNKPVMAKIPCTIIDRTICHLKED